MAKLGDWRGPEKMGSRKAGEAEIWIHWGNPNYENVG